MTKNQRKASFFRLSYERYSKKYRLLKAIKDFLFYTRKYLRISRQIAQAPVARFYSSHLKHILIFRVLRNLYFHPLHTAKRPIKAAYLSIRRLFNIYLTYTDAEIAISSQPIDFNTVSSTTIQEASTHISPPPKFYFSGDFKPIMKPHLSQHTPDIKCYTLKNASVIGSTSFLAFENVVVPPMSFQAQRDMTWIELQREAIIRPDEMKIRFYRGGKINRKIESAINLIGQCTGNYAHFLTEVLPKVILADQLGIDPRLPLLVDGWIDNVFFRILKEYNINSRPIIRVGLFEKVLVEKLIHIAEIAYVPAGDRRHYQTNELPYPESEMFMFSKYALGQLRKASFARTAKISEKLRDDLKNKQFLFLKRSSSSWNKRLILEGDELQRQAERFGFYSVDPASLSFMDQVLLFQQAKVVVSPIGAAMVNTLFSPKGCKVIALSPYYENANYYYFSNLMAALGHELHYVLGPQSKSSIKSDISNRDYHIDPDLLETLLSNQIEKPELRNKTTFP